MRNIVFMMSVVALLSMASCKTSESNYRAAYEVAKSKQKGDIDEETYNRMRQEAQPRTAEIGGDSLRVTDAAVKVYQGERSLQRYNVVVGSFRQVFNAQAMCQRLDGAGYEAYIIYDGEPRYYVVAAGADSETAAVAGMKRVIADKAIVLREPYPYILRPVNMR